MQDITGSTQVYGILADPIHHVETPRLINRWFAERGIDAVMVPLHVRPEDLSQLLGGLRLVRSLRGFVVTVPHKVAAATLCDELTPEARLVGAVNVVHRTADGRLIGGMLDGKGFVDALRSEGLDPAGRSAYLAGAGGAASAIAFALADAGVSRLTIANRTADKAQHLIDGITRRYPALHLSVGSEDPTGHDLVVNATSLGLRPGDPLPLDANRLAPHQAVVEIIAHPAETPLLKAARARRCRAQGGAPMLAHQIERMAAFMGGALHEELDHERR